jgi:hypothetical protein
MKILILCLTLASAIAYGNGNVQRQESIDENHMPQLMEERQNETSKIENEKYIPATEDRQEEESVEHYTPDLIDGEVLEDDLE